MAYTYFAETHEGRSGKADSKYSRNYTRNFIVKTDSATYGPYYAGSHPSLPVLWAAHPEDAKARVTTISPTQDGADPTLWRVTVEYSYPDLGQGTGDPKIDTQQQGQDPADRQENPLSRLNDYQISTSTYPYAVTQTIYGQAIKNTAGDPFLPPIEIQKMGATITVGTNQTSSPSAAWLQSVGCLNSNSMLIGPYSVSAAQVRLDSISAQLTNENSVKYWRWTLVFQYRADWAFVLLNQGRRQLNGGVAVPIYDKATGLEVSAPVPLDAAGAALSPAGTPVWLTFHCYPRVTFPAVI
jgi:hypothetical protein